MVKSAQHDVSAQKRNFENVRSVAEGSFPDLLPGADAAAVARTGERRLGTWDFPSGNRCDVVLRVDDGRAQVWFAWDSPPPLSDEDSNHYVGVVVPAVIATVLASREGLDGAR